MKKTIILIIVVLISPRVSFAQKFAYVDMKYILSNIPDYIDAQKKVDAQSDTWQKEIKDKYDAIDKMQKDYKGQEVLLSDDMKKQKLQDIDTKEKEAKTLQTQYFGYRGDLFNLREKLVKPIQDKVYDAIQKVASTKNYDMIFDKSEGALLMYVNPKMDVSDQVLTNLGYSPRTVPAGSNNQSKFPTINLQLPGQSTPSSGTPGSGTPPSNNSNSNNQNNNNNTPPATPVPTPQH